jgi:hypothetical protein
MNSFNELLDAALRFASKDWLVLPLHSIENDGGCTCGRLECSSSGKHPRTAHGLKDATKDVEQIHR